MSLEILREIFNRIDPGGCIISLEDQWDEYDDEIKDIMPYLRRGITQEQLKKHMEFILEKSLCCKIPTAKVEALVLELMPLCV
jgi:hypothetical protein